MLGNVEEWTYKTNLRYSTVQENEEAKENLGKPREDGSIVTSSYLSCPLYTSVPGKSFKSFANGFKNILYQRRSYNCNVQENDLGFRVVRTVE